MKVLVVASHPDDEILGCGGTMANLAQAGAEIYVLILGEGITSRSDSPDQADPAELEQLRDTATRANEICGTTQLWLESLPDNRFDTVPLLDIVKSIKRRVDQVQPQVVFTQAGGDLNIDHAITYRATLTACRPVAQSSIEQLYAYEVASSSEWSFRQFSPAFEPNVFVDISQSLETKVRAMEAYVTEARPYPHPRSPEALRSLAATRGVQAGYEAAEAFQLVYSRKGKAL